MATGDIFKTKYVTWNNFGLEKQDADLTSYQLLAHLTDQLDIHEGTMFRFHQSQQDVATDSKDYIQNFELLQYDILYGKRYCYNGDKDPYPASDLVMGIDETSICLLYTSVSSPVPAPADCYIPFRTIQLLFFS